MGQKSSAYTTSFVHPRSKDAYSNHVCKTRIATQTRSPYAYHYTNVFIQREGPYAMSRPPHLLNASGNVRNALP